MARRMMLQQQQNAPTTTTTATMVAAAEPSGPTSSSSNNNKANIAIACTIATSSLALFVLLLAFVYFFYMRHRARNRAMQPGLKPKGSESSIEGYIRSHRLEPVQAQVFSYKQLQSATNNFSRVNEIGHGGFGSVYRGVLPDGRLAAVKVLNRKGRQGEREFRVEVDMLTRLNSPYLLDLIGYCADQQFRLLVYSYMPNGSLQEHLHPNGTLTDPCVLDWGTRIMVAFDSARGLEYLHEYVNPPIIHRDFKSSNILLNENYEAVLADFGLAKMSSDKVGSHTSARVLGTQGYVAPEYAMTGHLTTKSDVYSYGVVLLELITGKNPVDTRRPAGQTHLAQWALPGLTDRAKLAQMVDPLLKTHYNMKELVQLAAIAAMCVQPEPDYRPLITDVVHSLVPLVRQRRTTPKNLSLASPRKSSAKVCSNVI